MALDKSIVHKHVQRIIEQCGLERTVRNLIQPPATGRDISPFSNFLPFQASTEGLVDQASLNFLSEHPFKEGKALSKLNLK